MGLMNPNLKEVKQWQNQQIPAVQTVGQCLRKNSRKPSKPTRQERLREHPQTKRKKRHLPLRQMETQPKRTPLLQLRRNRLLMAMEKILRQMRKRAALRQTSLRWLKTAETEEMPKMTRKMPTPLWELSHSRMRILICSSLPSRKSLLR